MRILFDHIAIGVTAVGEVTDFLVGELGGTDPKGGPSGPFDFWQWSYQDGARLEVIEPAGPPGGFLHRFLEQRGPGLHHVTFKVADLDAICARAESLGYRVVGYDASSPSWKEAFLHPKEALGIVVQFAESHPELEGERPQPTPPPGPERAAHTVRLVGLRMRAPELAPVVKQWEALLGGAREERIEGGIPLHVFRWPDSPLRLAIEIGPGPARPLWVELAELGDVELPAAPHPRLGTRFVALAV